MFKYVIKRLLIGCLTLWILATITFFGVKAMPGDPFSSDNRVLTPQAYAALEAKYGFDKPVIEQYFIYLNNALHGDFGDCIKKDGWTVADVIRVRAPVTARLGATAFVLAVVVGLVFGIVAALSKRRSVNSIITVFATMGVSIPGFLLAMILMIIFAVQLGWLPVVGLTTPKHYILPALAMSFSPISMITRLTRSSLRDVMSKDYVTLARSKGTKELIIVIKHELRNALLPVVTYCGPMFASMVTGSMVVETLFSVQGIGAEFTTSITNRDYTLVMGLTLFFGAIVIVMNLISDIVAAAMDPRIKLGK